MHSRWKEERFPWRQRDETEVARMLLAACIISERARVNWSLPFAAAPRHLGPPNTPR